MSATTAFTIFAMKVSKERRIPFDVTADPDPFYSDANMKRLKKAISDVKSGKAKLTEREFVETGKLEIWQCGSHYRDK
jgi:DNA-damage-inducible protein J